MYPLLVTDVLRSMFNYLYDEDIVSDDTFYRWETSGMEDPHVSQELPGVAGEGGGEGTG